METKLEISKLNKSIEGNKILKNISFTISSGKITVILGPNGSGKSTTISCVLGLLKFDKGEVKVFGKPMEASSYESKKDIGVVLQNVAVFEELNVEENIDYFCGLYIKDKKLRKQYVDEAIEFAGLEEFRKFVPKKLSGGLLRRLNIACGIAHKPKLIFMDEPTVAVDPQSRNKILEGIVELNKKGATIIYTSHYMEEVEQICTRIAIMDQGKNLAIGTKEQLKDMIKTGESIQVEILDLADDVIEEVKSLPHVYKVEYADNHLKVHYTKGQRNLVRLIDFFKDKGISFGRVYSELPTLNDVFLEITGKELRD